MTDFGSGSLIPSPPRIEWHRGLAKTPASAWLALAEMYPEVALRLEVRDACS